MIFTEHERQFWQPFRNDSESTIPAFGVFRFTGAVVVHGFQYLKAAQPNIYGSQYAHYVNDGTPVAPGAYGQCATVGLFAAAYDSGTGTPAAGDVWGTRSGSFLLQAKTGGFRVVSVISSTDHIVLVHREPFTRFRGVADVDIAKSSSGEVSIYALVSGSFTDTTDALTVKSETGDVDAGAVVFCEWLGDLAGQYWIVVTAECAS